MSSPPASSAGRAQQQQQQRRSSSKANNPVARAAVGSLTGSGAAARCLKKMVLQQLAFNEELAEFREFEELSKLYSIEPPYLSKTQIELIFDVYDGRKIQLSGLLEELAGAELDSDQEVGEPEREPGASELPSQRPSLSGAKGSATATGSKPSWCRLLFARHHNKLAGCISKSETQNEFPLSPSESNNLIFGPNSSQKLASNSSEPICAALAPNIEDDQENIELKSEALQMIGPLLSQLRRSSTLSDASKLRSQSIHSNLNQPQQMLDLATLAESGQISVCILDKRTRMVKKDSQSGRLWLEFELALEEFCFRLRGSRACLTNRRLLEERVRSFQFKFKRKLEAKVKRSSSRRYSNKRRSIGFIERLPKEQLDTTIELTKTSLNHLIDAQLMLRNKLSSEQQQQQQQQTNLLGGVAQSNQQIIIRSNEYETLLRNNFNLLKIWQNLEETKHLACFVCEPIKATLADLFWFSRHQTSSFGLAADADLADSPSTSSTTTTTLVEAGVMISSLQINQALLTSPLVSLDAIQVRIGLLQILEALHYLHAICKLIHRNVNPRNILVASNDNWKLSGLEFAIRFESAAISESASIMAHDGAGSLLHYSSGVGPQATLRRQRTLHQTRCDDLEAVQADRKHAAADKEPARPTPDVNYLAPEMYKSSRCSHKSDIFSFGLVVAQTYDLRRHKPPINCELAGRKQSVAGGGYEEELKKLLERRKRRLGRVVPFEMRPVLMEMLDCEPNNRPSANYALQLFRRPIELCKLNEDSLRHLKSSLAYLDTRWLLNNNSNFIMTNNINNNNINSQQGAALVSELSPASGVAHKKRINYFRRVTLAADRSPQRKQTRNLHLLNLLCRGVDSLALGNNNSDREQQQTFGLLKYQFEQTFECLKQLHKSNDPQPPETTCCPDSRSLMLAVALHRRLLDQLALMRSELPPVCRLTAPNYQSNRVAENHRVLAELEERFQCLASRQSITKLIPLLTDPLLKLDEFLLLYELLADLLAFVGQKCRQNFIQRGKQLLSELTPVTGCPSLSSSDEDESIGNDYNRLDALVTSVAANAPGSRRQLQTRSMHSNSNSRLAGHPSSASPSISGHRMSDFEGAISSEQAFTTGNYTTSNININNNNRSQFRQSTNLPVATKISITAPSPMGSTRDMARASLDSSGSQLNDNSRRFARLQQDERDITKRVSDLNLTGNYQDNFVPEGEEDNYLEEFSARQQQRNGSASTINYQQEEEQQDFTSNANQTLAPEERKSRNQLIDELLKTINDDNFNDYVEFNNKFASTSSSSASAVQVANSQRPKSAIDGGSSRQGPDSGVTKRGSFSPQQLQQQQQQQTLSTSTRPNSLALNNSNNSSQRNQASSRSGATPSTFDNVFRRMSTNLVQNFNKMSGLDLDNNNSLAGQQTSGININDPYAQPIASGSSSNLIRREKSSNYCANSLYVDNQVPARRHSDNTINIPRIQVALSSPSGTQGSRTNLNQRASVSASKLANKWKLSAKTNQREASDKLSPNLSGALSYMRRHSSGNTTGNEQNHSNGPTTNLLFNASPFKTKSSSNLGLDFLLSNRSMKRRCSAASMLGHQTQRKAEDLLDAGMKSVKLIGNILSESLPKAKYVQLGRNMEIFGHTGISNICGELR